MEEPEPDLGPVQFPPGPRTCPDGHAPPGRPGPRFPPVVAPAPVVEFALNVLPLPCVAEEVPAEPVVVYPCVVVEKPVELCPDVAPVEPIPVPDNDLVEPVVEPFTRVEEELPSERVPVPDKDLVDVEDVPLPVPVVELEVAPLPRVLAELEPPPELEPEDE